MSNSELEASLSTDIASVNEPAPLIYNMDLLAQPNSITNLLLIDRAVPAYQTFIDSANSTTFPVAYSWSSSKSELLTLLQGVSCIERIGFVFEARGSSSQLFLDNKPFFIVNEVTPYSENLEWLLSVIRDFGVKNVDFLACNSLNMPEYNAFYGILLGETGVVVGASNDATGNIKYGGDWVMESTMEDIEMVYFKESIEYYKYLLKGSNTQHVVILMSDRTIYSTGKNTKGQLGIANNNNVNKLTKMQNMPAGKTPIAISCGDDHTIVLMSGGTIYGTGDNTYGQLGNNNTTNVNILTEMTTIPSGKTPIAISCGNVFTIVLMSDGTIYGCGGNGNGQFGNNDNTAINTILTQMTSIPSGKTPIAISCGVGHTIVLMSDGSIYGCGNNDFGQIILPSGGNKKILTSIYSEKTAKAIACGSYTTIVLMSDGTIYGAGYTPSNEFGFATYTYQPLAQIYATPLSGKTPIAISAGTGSTAVLLSDGTIYGTSTNIPSIPSGKTPIAISSGYVNIITLMSDGTIYSAGNNEVGTLGISNNTNASNFTELTSTNYSPAIPVRLNDSSYNLTVTQLKSAGKNATQLKNAGYTAVDLRVGGYSVTQLKEPPYPKDDILGAGYPASDLSNANYTALDLKNSGKYTDSVIIGTGFDVSQMYTAGYNATSLKNNYSVVQLKGTQTSNPPGYTDYVILRAGYTASDLSNAKYLASDLQSANYPISDLKPLYSKQVILTAGYNATALKNAGYFASDLQSANYPISDLKPLYADYDILRAGYPASDLSNAQYLASDLQGAGYPVSDLISLYSKDVILAAGYQVVNLKPYYSPLDLKNSTKYIDSLILGAGYLAKDLRVANYSASDLKGANYTATQLQVGGYSVNDLQLTTPIAYTNSEILAAGFTSSQLKVAGYTSTQLYSAGYNANQVQAAGYADWLLLTPNSNVIKQSYFNGFLDISGTTLFRQDISMNGPLTVSSNTVFPSDVSMNSRLYVSGNTTINGNLNVNSILYANFASQSISASAISGSIVPSFSTDIIGSSRLFVTNDVSFNSRLQVFGDVSLNGALQTTGNIIINTINPASFYNIAVNTWTPNTTAPTGYNWSSISMSSNGQYQISTDSNSSVFVYTSSNYGSTWNTYNINNLFCVYTAVSSSGQYQFVFTNTSSNNGTIYISSNYGSTFVTSCTNTGSSFPQYAVSGNGQYIYTKLLYSTNYGASYNPTSGITRWDSTVNSIAVSYNGQYVSTGSISTNKVYISSNYGLSFSSSASYSSSIVNNSIGTVYSLSMSSNGQYQSLVTLTTTAGNYSIWTSTNYGNLWTFNTSAAYSTSIQWNMISVSSAGNYQVASRGDGYIYVSSNYGSTWNTTLATAASWTGANSTGTSNTWNGLAISSTGQYLSAVTYGGQIFTSTSTLLTNNKLNVSNTSTISNVDTTLNSRLFVKNIASDVSMNGNLTISGNLTTSGNLIANSLNQVNNISTFSGNVTINGNLYSRMNTILVKDVSMSSLLYVNGNISTNKNVIAGGSQLSTSDYRIKENVVKLDSSYTVDDLNPVYYYNKLINKEDLGLIAHELQESYPLLVTGDKDGDEFQRVNYIGLIPVLIKEIQELKRKIKIRNEQLDELERHLIV